MSKKIPQSRILYLVRISSQGNQDILRPWKIKGLFHQQIYSKRMAKTEFFEHKGNNKRRKQNSRKENREKIDSKKKKVRKAKSVEKCSLFNPTVAI